MTAVRVYVEGGGDQKNSSQLLQNGIAAFLGNGLRLLGMSRRPKVILCGGNRATFDYFAVAIAQHPESICVLLVDAEGPVDCTPAEHLQRTHGWTRPQQASENQLHLMVQTMEAWIVADPDALSAFYDQKFIRKKLSKRADVEQIPKDELLNGLKLASRQTRAGEYQKIKHASLLLERIDPGKVMVKARHLKSLLEFLKNALGT